MNVSWERLDLNQLVVLQVLLEEENVTRAAVRLGVGQPAMSASLARLRRLLDDDLLVRQGRRMVRTPVADALQSQAALALERFDRVLAEQRGFDPAASTATFTILASDYVALVLLRPLVQRFESEARHVRLRMRPISPDFGAWLRAGRADLALLPREIAIGSTGLRRAPAFVDRYVYVADVDNDAARRATSWAQMQSLPHVGYGGDKLPSAGQLALANLEPVIEQDLTTQTFVLAAYLVQGTDYVSLVPERLARYLSDRLQIAAIEPPGRIPPIHETAYWSARTDNDEAHRWLRREVLAAAEAL